MGPIVPLSTLPRVTGGIGQLKGDGGWLVVGGILIGPRSRRPGVPVGK